MLVPALRDTTSRLWPFDGPLDALLTPGKIVLAETYPAECYRWFFQMPIIKSSLESRRQAGPTLLHWAKLANVTLAPDLRQVIDAGFPQGDDAFDAVVGLFGMLEVLMGRRGSGEPDSARSVEGWILGQLAP